MCFQGHRYHKRRNIILVVLITRPSNAIILLVLFFTLRRQQLAGRYAQILIVLADLINYFSMSMLPSFLCLCLHFFVIDLARATSGVCFNKLTYLLTYLVCVCSVCAIPICV